MSDLCMYGACPNDATGAMELEPARIVRLCDEHQELMRRHIEAERRLLGEARANAMRQARELPMGGGSAG